LRGVSASELLPDSLGEYFYVHNNCTLTYYDCHILSLNLKKINYACIFGTIDLSLNIKIIPSFVKALPNEDISHVVIKSNFYRDSLQLMRISEKLRQSSGVSEASIVMATETNKGVLIRLGFSPSLIEQANESDMIIAVRAKDQQSIDLASEQIGKLFESSDEEDRLGSRDEEKTTDIDLALRKMPGTNLVLLSIPGEYVKDISYKLIEQGIHQQIFSDHVPVEDELKIKKQAVAKGVLILGPGAGTSIINGKGIGFSNTISVGPVGIVAAAGTGLQEVVCLLDQCGIGVKHGLGVGGNDPKDKVGGIMMLECMKILEKDDDIKVIAIISKPPSPSVEQKIMEYVIGNGTKKKYVLAFIGGQLTPAGKKEQQQQHQQLEQHSLTEGFHSQAPSSANTTADHHTGIVKVNSLASCVLAIANALGNQELQKTISQLYIQPEGLVNLLQSEWSKLQSNQKYIRALYTGGTFTYEAQVILRDVIDGVQIHSNAPIEKIKKLQDSFKSEKHSVIDLGEEEFTKGRPHPMIDPTIRKFRILEEAKDPEVGVILLDFVLGYGSNPDPVGAVIDELQLAKEIARKQGYYLPVITHVCGTKNDVQGYDRSISKLHSVGCIVMPTNALAVIASALIAQRGQIELGSTYSSYIELPHGGKEF
jgi:FdrA protein